MQVYLCGFLPCSLSTVTFGYINPRKHATAVSSIRVYLFKKA
jgi:hypothetical protein